LGGRNQKALAFEKQSRGSSLLRTGGNGGQWVSTTSRINLRRRYELNQGNGGTREKFRLEMSAGRVKFWSAGNKLSACGGRRERGSEVKGEVNYVVRACQFIAKKKYRNLQDHRGGLTRRLVKVPPSAPQTVGER